MAIKLDKMSRKELEALRADIDEAIVQRRKSERHDALAAAQKAAAEYGFSLDELTSKKSGRGSAKASSAEPKYMNPENPAQTWTGKGRQPNWFKAAVEAGTPAEKMEI
ncbi:H-NS histone family protein [uncultured Tateyamaria sp.]|uniref:H-NS histone family protein n=1 Tax=uncultured Tateyamaria sp. TaxID=455651 RepID=UPI00263449A2|nr:H-NS histone family protein [uncultured Tateyamaria sp.]